MVTTTYKLATLPTVGGDSGTWGTILNTSTLATFDNNLGGIVTKSLTNANVTLNATESQMAILRLTGVLSGNVQITTACQGFTIVENLCTLGAYTVTITNGVGTPLTLPTYRSLVVFDATNGARLVANEIIPNASITYAKLQNISATSRILGRKTAGAGSAEECTLSDVLDFVGSATQGDILYRNASTWTRLGVGTSGQFLQTQGAGANPQWAMAGGLILLTSGTVTNAATLNIVLTSYTGYRGIEFVLESFIPATNDVELSMRFSTNGGSTFVTSGYRFVTQGLDSNGTSQGSVSASTESILIAGNTTSTYGISNVANDNGVHVKITLFNQTSTAKTRILGESTYALAADRLAYLRVAGDNGNAQDTDAVQFVFATGNIASGIYAVYGYL